MTNDRKLETTGIGTRLRAICLSLALIALSMATARADDPPAAGETEPTKRVNVLVILADDLGFSDLGCYGGEIQTPQLDQLAAHGLRYTQFYNTGRCWPTRAALMSGYYAQQVRRDTVPGVVSGGGGARPPWAPLLPAMLKPLGYRAYHSGKWHLDGPRLAAGFDRSYSLEDHDRYFQPRQHSRDDQPLAAISAESDYYVTTAIADHAIECLREHQAEHRDRPFFQYLCFTAPHFPLQAPASEIAPYRTRYALGWNVLRTERWQRLRELSIVNCELSRPEPAVGPPYHFPEALQILGATEVNRPVPWSELNAAQQEYQAAKMAIHAAMVTRMDREIGRVLDQLRSLDLWEQTLVLFLSDNGASAEIMVRGDGHDAQAALGSASTFLCLGPGWSSAANTPFRRHKTWMHEGGIATPLIVHWPAGFAARGELRHTPGHVIDLVPTVLEVAERGAPAPLPSLATVGPSRPGKSLLASFTRDEPGEQRTLWWLHEGNRALRQGNWKLVAAKDEPWQLYNLATDRAEQDDQAPAEPERVAELTREWQSRAEAYFRDAARATE